MMLKQSLFFKWFLRIYITASSVSSIVFIFAMRIYKVSFSKKERKYQNKHYIQNQNYDASLNFGFSAGQQFVSSKFCHTQMRVIIR